MRSETETELGNDNLHIDGFSCVDCTGQLSATGTLHVKIAIVEIQVPVLLGNCLLSRDTCGKYMDPTKKRKRKIRFVPRDEKLLQIL